MIPQHSLLGGARKKRARLPTSLSSLHSFRTVVVESDHRATTHRMAHYRRNAVLESRGKFASSNSI